MSSEFVSKLTTALVMDPAVAALAPRTVRARDPPPLIGARTKIGISMIFAKILV